MIPVVVVFTTQIARHSSETAGRHIHNILITMQTVRLGDIASAERMKLPIYWEDQDGQVYCAEAGLHPSRSFILCAIRP